MYRNSVRSLSLATYCDVRNHTGELLVVRNRTTFELTGKTVFGPIGGGVSVPSGVLQQVLNELADFSPSTERKPSDEGLTDLRFTLQSPAIGEGDMAKLDDIVNRIVATLPDDCLSPLRELHEELVDEEAILEAADLCDVRITRGARYMGAYILTNHRAPEEGNRLYGNVVAGVTLPAVTMGKLTVAAEAHPDIIRFVAPGDVKSGVRSKLLAPATGVLASQS